MDKPLGYKCGHCMGPFTDFEDCVAHLCAVHPHEELYIMVPILNETTGMRSHIPRRWKYTPTDCNVEGWELKGTSNEKYGNTRILTVKVQIASVADTNQY